MDINERKVLGFQTFSNSSEFEEWQINNPNYRVANIIPVVASADAEETDRVKLELKTDISVFVTYWRWTRPAV